MNKILLATLVSLPLAAVAQTADLDAALAGFDEPAAPVESLDDALQGFDEAPRDGLDAVLDGFDETPASATTASTAPSNWRPGGDLLLSSSYTWGDARAQGVGTDYQGLSRLRAKLNGRLDGSLGGGWDARVTGYAFHDFAYGLRGREEYTDEVLESLENEAELGEAFVRGPLSDRFDLKIGRQIVVWGKSDNLRVTDVLNPLDNREPGMVDIEDLRLPVAMTRLDYYAGDWNLTAAAIHETRFNKNPPFGSDFYPLPSPQPPEELPGDGGENTEYAAALNGVFSGWDLSFYWAQVFDDQAYQQDPFTPLATLRHSRTTMAGGAVNAVVGSWLLKAEAAAFSGLRYSLIPDEKERLDVLLGAEYSGIAETTLALELVNRHLVDYESPMAQQGVEEDAWQAAARYQGDFLNSRLHLTAVSSLLDGGGGGFSRLSAKYDLRDALSVTGGVVLYHAGNQFPFNAIADNDRLFVDVKYSF